MIGIPLAAGENLQQKILLMQKAVIALFYHGGKGHTAQSASRPASRMQTPQTVVQLTEVAEAANNFDDFTARTPLHPDTLVASEMYRHYRDGTSF